ncbi:MAG: GTP-binding protein [Clostridium sp.]|nr:GTP-binding protein [Clostridium sp.]
MTKISVFSGFLGAGKTTLIKKLLKEAFAGEQVVLIENEFGEIGIDGGFLKEAGIEIKEMNSGCICCSLVGDFGTSLKEVLATYHPERILIEPSGVGKLSDVIRAVENVDMGDGVTLDSAVAVVDASKAKMYIKNFGEFFINQIEHAGTIVLSRTGNLAMEKLEEAIALIREHNAKAVIITTPWDEIDGKDILKAMEGSSDLKDELIRELMAHEDEHEHHHHHDHDDDEDEDDHDHDHEHHHHHDDDDDDHDHDHEHHHHHDHDEDDDDDHDHEHHHHHDHDEDDHDHEHHHHHDHDEDDDDHDHEHHHHHDHDEDDDDHDHDHEHHHHHHDGECGCHHHHHHDADEVFQSWGMETPAHYSQDEIERILTELDNAERYGIVLRAKGMVAGENGTWVYFDYVPEERNVREGKPDVTGKFCVIGSKLNEEHLKELFAK